MAEQQVADLREWTAVWAKDVQLGDTVGVHHDVHMHVGKIVRMEREEIYAYAGESSEIRHVILENRAGVQHHYHWYPFSELYMSVTKGIPTTEPDPNNTGPLGSE